MLLKKSAMGRRRATIESRAMTSRIELARSVVVLNQYCSEDPLKILFQQHRPKADIERPIYCDAQRGGRRRQIATAAIRSIGAVFSLTRAVKGHMNSPWTVRTTPAVSVHVRVAFRRGRGICGCIELICYQITKAPAGSGGGLVLSV